MGMQITTACEEQLQAVNRRSWNAVRDHNGLPWMANPLVLRHARRITSARIAASQIKYSMFATNRLLTSASPSLNALKTWPE